MKTKPSLKLKTVTDNSDIPQSAPIITGRKAGGGNKRAADTNVMTRKSIPWQQLAAKREPFAWRAFRRAFLRIHSKDAAIYGYEWEWFLEGWKRRVRSEPMKTLLRYAFPFRPKNWSPPG